MSNRLCNNDDDDLVCYVDYRLKRRLVFRALYDVECTTSEGNVAESVLTVTMARHTFTYTEICGSGQLNLFAIDHCFAKIMMFNLVPNFLSLTSLNCCPIAYIRDVALVKPNR